MLPEISGRNYWTFNPRAAFTCIGDTGFEVSAKVLNTVNSATGYVSGQELIVDYLAGQHLGNWNLGVNGYYYKQTTDDSTRGAGPGSNGNKGRTFSIGPAIQYNCRNMFFNVKYQRIGW